MHANRPTVITHRFQTNVAGDLPVRVMVTMKNTLTFDERMTYDEAKAFFPWLSRTYPSTAGGSMEFRADCTPPDNYVALGEPVIPKAMREKILTQFAVYYHTTYTAHGRRPF